ncbi:hypothetical protein RKD21_006432 [Streptomyces albogriseolus]|uniref:Uncharacterized protein n=1 Tax=Streptomyces albogriseolus TaxID=1887 RepID=A0ACC6UXJ8_STRAO
MPDQLGGLRLGVGEGLLGLAQLAGQGLQPRRHLAQPLGLVLTLPVDAVQLPGPAVRFGLAEPGALTDLPQQIGGEPAQRVPARRQPLPALLQHQPLLLQRGHAAAQRRVVVGGAGPARRPRAHDPHVEHGRRETGGQLGVQGPVDGRRGDRTESHLLRPGPQFERRGAFDVGAVLGAGDGGDGEGDRGDRLR